MIEKQPTIQNFTQDRLTKIKHNIYKKNTNFASRRWVINGSIRKPLELINTRYILLHNKPITYK